MRGYDVTFMDISPQAKDIIQAHAWQLPFADNSVDVIFCDFPFTPSLMDDRLNDPRLEAHYSRDPRLFYQTGPAELNSEDLSKRKGGKSSMAFIRDGGRTKITRNEQLYMGLQHDISKYWESPNPRMRPGNTLALIQQNKQSRADTYVRNAAPIMGKSKNPIHRFIHANRTTGSHLSNQFVRPYLNFQNTWAEFNRVSRDGLIVKIGEYHKEWHYYPGDFEAAMFYDHRWNKQSQFEWVSRIFYKGVRPMVHQVPHPQPILTFYMVFKKSIKSRGTKPRRSKIKSPKPTKKELQALMNRDTIMPENIS